MRKIDKKNKDLKILLIIPAYNEEDNILRVYNEIKKYNNENKTNYDVIVINDGSKDQTGKICQDNNIPVINLTIIGYRWCSINWLQVCS